MLVSCKRHDDIFQNKTVTMYIVRVRVCMRARSVRAPAHVCAREPFMPLLFIIINNYIAHFCPGLLYCNYLPTSYILSHSLESVRRFNRQTRTTFKSIEYPNHDVLLFDLCSFDPTRFCAVSNGFCFDIILLLTYHAVAEGGKERSYFEI